MAAVAGVRYCTAAWRRRTVAESPTEEPNSEWIERVLRVFPDLAWGIRVLPS
jgi:hypothetical protein